MSDKYKINIDKPKPTDQEVDQFKNFDRVLNQYQRTTRRRSLHSIISKQNKLFPIVIIVLLIVALFYYFKVYKKAESEKIKNNKKSGYYENKNLKKLPSITKQLSYKTLNILFS